jgi:transposase-like protein
LPVSGPYLYLAIDQYGQVIDVLLSLRRDLAAARRFFTRGHYDISTDVPNHHRLRTAFDDLAFTI